MLDWFMIATPRKSQVKLKEEDEKHTIHEHIVMLIRFGLFLVKEYFYSVVLVLFLN